MVIRRPNSYQSPKQRKSGSKVQSARIFLKAGSFAFISYIYPRVLHHGRQLGKYSFLESRLKNLLKINNIHKYWYMEVKGPSAPWLLVEDPFFLAAWLCPLAFGTQAMWSIPHPLAKQVHEMGVQCAMCICVRWECVHLTRMFTHIGSACLRIR